MTLDVPFHILPQLQIWLSTTTTWFHTLYNWVLLIKHKNVYSSPQHKCSIALSSRSQTMLMMAWMLDLSADQWRINEFSLRETFDNNPILSVTRRAAHINNKQRCVSIDLSNQNFHVGEWSKWKVGPDKWGQLGRSRKLKGGVMMLVQLCRYHVFLSTLEFLNFDINNFRKPLLWLSVKY